MVTAFLTLGSASWLALLTLFPSLCAAPLFLGGTIFWIAVNGVVSLLVLFRKKKLLFLVNVLQVLLFALLFCQVNQTLGRHHFRVAGEPLFFDWQLFAWAHALHAADLVHFLSGYGLSLPAIENRTPLAGVLLILMHVQVTLYVLGLLVRWVGKVWTRWQGQASPQEKRRWKKCLRRILRIGLAGILTVVLTTAILSGWSLETWFLWQLDNVLRTLDVGAVQMVFGWQLHSIESSPWTGTLGILFRLLAGSFLLSWLHTWQLYWLGGRALRPLDDFIEDLQDPEERTRQAAASALGDIGPDAKTAVPQLLLALDDDSGPVGSATRLALAQVGPPPAYLLPDLIAHLRHPNWTIRRAAAVVLGQMGPRALACVPTLVEKLADEDHLTQERAEAALQRIYPGWETGSLGRPAIPRLVVKLNHSQRRLRQRAAEVLGWFGPGAKVAVPALLRALHDEQEYVRLSAEWALDAIEPGWARRVHVMMPLLEEVRMGGG